MEENTERRGGPAESLRLTVGAVLELLPAEWPTPARRPPVTSAPARAIGRGAGSEALTATWCRRAPGKPSSSSVSSLLRVVGTQGQRCVEVLWYHEVPPGGSQHAFRRGLLNWYQTGHRLASLGDDDLLAQRHSLQKPGQVSLGLVDVYVHTSILD